ncbi:MAG: tetratricopeptide repeat protein [Bacteroidota bacterium]
MASLSQQDIDLITRHLGDELSSSEQALFEEKLKSSDNFAEEVQLQKTMVQAILVEDDTLLRQELKEEAILKRGSLSSKSAISWYYKVAASLLILITIGYFLLPSDASLFEHYYSPLPETPITRSTSAADDHYYQAMQLYSLGDYQKAAQAFSLVVEDSLQYEVALYRGNCLLNIDDYDRAIDEFQKAVALNHPDAAMHSQWFLALSYIKTHQKEKAGFLLTEVIQSDSPYRTKASDLQRKLIWSVR